VTLRHLWSVMPLSNPLFPGIGDFHSPGEDLIEMTTHYMGDSCKFECTREVKVVQFTVYVVDVIVEITTYQNCCFRILLDDILDDICHSLCSVYFELFFSGSR
jgi:hypothetical protein